ncbi:hypothetical protein HF577_35510 [Pseudonocardia xinjiangensis]|uniref:Membrane-associated protein n=1 Tax=Pseudonocardia xinjiangensis TaxID=75289 RepID=A0ABX1RPS7_9PSEU|nr:hypothetical protein [Pseudonocardia xinjiangensis]NMH82383.1 hypothetical protein [Pseudonocardia xinjiangensis]
MAQRPAVAPLRLPWAAIVLTALLDALASLPAPLVLVVAALVLVAESGTLVGIALPGSTLLVALGLWSHTAPDALLPAIAVAAAGTVTGAHVSRWRGRSHQDGLGSASGSPGRWRRAVQARAVRAQHWLAGRGPAATAVLLACGHWAAAARPLMPRIAGGAGVPYRIAGPAMVASGTAWAATFVLLGNSVGAHVLTHGTWAPIALVVLLIGGLMLQSRRRSVATGSAVR